MTRKSAAEAWREVPADDRLHVVSYMRGMQFDYDPKHYELDDSAKGLYRAYSAAIALLREAAARPKAKRKGEAK